MINRKSDDERILTKKCGYDIHKVHCGIFYGEGCDSGQDCGAFFCHFCMETVAWCADIGSEKYSVGQFGACLDCYEDKDNGLK